MAKTGASKTLSPTSISVGAAAYYEHVRDTIEQLNYTAQHSIVTQFANFVCAPSGWDATAGTAAPTHNVKVPGAWATFYEFDIFVSEDAVNLNVGVMFQCIAANTCQARFTVGAAGAVTLTADDTRNGLWTEQTITASSAGTGWRLVKIEIQRSAGASANNELRRVLVEGHYISAATALPDPPDE